MEFAVTVSFVVFVIFVEFTVELSFVVFSQMMFALSWCVFSILALRELHANSSSLKNVSGWVFMIIMIPLLGAITFWVLTSRPTKALFKEQYTI